MAAAELDILIEQGTSFKKTFTHKDKDGNLIDLTGCSFAGQIRKATGDATILATFTCTLQAQSGPTLGSWDLKLTSLQTASLPLKAQKLPKRTLETFAYDVEITYPSGDKERVLQGLANVSPEVTVQA